MRPPFRLAPMLALAAALAGCSAMTPPAATSAPALDGTAWTLAALPGRPLAPGATVTLGFSEGKAQGNDGCNRFSTPYSADGGKLAVSPRGAMTLMACPPERMEQAGAFMAALTGARAYRVEERRLVLLAADGSTLATLAAQDNALPGTAWRVTAINNGRQAVVSVAAGTTVSLAFADDGRVTGSSGCNTFNARYTADAARLRIQPPATTRRMCAGTELMQQEVNFLKALPTVATVRVEGDRLELRAADGALAITATRD